MAKKRSDLRHEIGSKAGRGAALSTNDPALAPSPEPVTIAPTLYPADRSGVVVVNNYITINFNSVEARQLNAKLDDILQALDQSNTVAGPARDQAKSEIEAGKSLLSAPKANRDWIKLLLINPLKWLAEKAGSAVLQKLAVDALFLLTKLM